MISRANEAVAAWQTGAIIYTSSLQEKKDYKRKKGKLTVLVIDRYREEAAVQCRVLPDQKGRLD